MLTSAFSTRSTYVIVCVTERITKLHLNGEGALLFSRDYGTEPRVMLVDGAITFFTSSTALQTVQNVCDARISVVSSPPDAGYDETTDRVLYSIKCTSKPSSTLTRALSFICDCKPGAVHVKASGRRCPSPCEEDSSIDAACLVA